MDVHTVCQTAVAEEGDALTALLAVSCSSLLFVDAK
jgi:hypothetical protein